MPHVGYYCTAWLRCVCVCVPVCVRACVRGFVIRRNVGNILEFVPSSWDCNVVPEGWKTHPQCSGGGAPHRVHWFSSSRSKVGRGVSDAGSDDFA